MKRILICLLLISIWPGRTTLAQTNSPFYHSYDLHVGFTGAFNNYTDDWLAGPTNVTTSDNGVSNGSGGFSSEFYIGTGGGEFRGGSVMLNNTLTRYEIDSMIGGYMRVDSLIAEWDTVTHIVLHLRYFGYTSPPQSDMSSEGWGIELWNAPYDTSGIFFPDTVLSHNQISCYYSNQSDVIYLANRERNRNWQTLSSVTTLDLSGLFHTTHLTNQLSVSAIVTASGISIYPRAGGFECRVPRSNRAETLDIYSPLGTKLRSYDLAANQDLLTVSNLPVGFYFVKTACNIAKVLVSE